MAKEQKAFKGNESTGFGFTETTATRKQGIDSKAQMPFGLINYIGMGISLLMILVGFWTMSMEKEFVDATKYSTALNVSPVLIVLGYAFLCVAIMLKPGGKAKAQ